MWDQNATMPPRRGLARADQMETLERILHERLTDPGLGPPARRAWSRGRPSEDPDSDDVRMVAVLRRDSHKAVRVPTELAARDLERRRARPSEAWRRRAQNGDFGALPPRARARPGAARTATPPASTARASSRTPTTSCSTTTSPGSPPPSCAAIFGRAAAGAGAAGLGGRGAGARGGARASCRATSRRDAQRALVDEILDAVGFDREHWRLDAAVHPFARSMAYTDVRITTPLGGATTSRWRSTRACTSSATACTRRRCSPRSTARRWPRRRGSACTSPRAGCGRTSSGRSRPFCEWVLPLLRRQLRRAVPGLDAAELYRAVNHGPAVARSGSRPTRRPTTCTSRCASSSSSR